MSGEGTMNAKTSRHPFDLLLEINNRNVQKSRSATPESAHGLGAKGQLAFRLTPWQLMFPMDEVAEIIPVPRITRIPGVKSWLLGIANLRGTVISVVDLREFLGGKPTAITASSRLIVVHLGEWTYGLLVDEIIGMRHFSPERKLPGLDNLDPHLLPYLSEGFESEQKIWLNVNVNRLLTDPKFVHATN